MSRDMDVLIQLESRIDFYNNSNGHCRLKLHSIPLSYYEKGGKDVIKRFIKTQVNWIPHQKRNIL